MRYSEKMRKMSKTEIVKQTICISKIKDACEDHTSCFDLQVLSGMIDQNLNNVVINDIILLKMIVLLTYR